ncbi:NfeD family protein [Pseudonocardia asaccharolytica]|uniref:Membrane protein n=1 Tax=Pseudonocardia asaccharolytica DSM 44247 = NBRC 16224 TaxID=1123024 RepID=A0A511CWT6_9PSEU|nr:NfeD family protein [Pseudonocardia asaccharolytica]GEL16713.1 membrane protein [Pseudonocardia asaccharolytica DSM 44247 = NBRC 16224]
MAAVIWLIAGIVLVAAEVLSGEFVLLMLGGGALIAALASVLGAGPVAGAIVFGGASVLLLFAVRPGLRRRLNRAIDNTAMHSDALLGREAVVVERVQGDHGGGRIKIDGDIWSARAYDHQQVIEPGARVRIVTITGATAMVLAED